MTNQRDEVAAWLGDGHGLDDGQVAELARLYDQIAERYPGPYDKVDREAALATAHELLVAADPASVVTELGGELLRARQLERSTLARMQQAAVQLVEPREAKPKGVRSQSGFARAAGVDRMLVLKWLGLRR